MNTAISLGQHTLSYLMGAYQRVKAVVAALLLALVLIMGGGVPTYAQEPTLVPLQFNGAINSMFSSSNSWMTNLAPVLSIGFGIMIALAILGLIGWIIVAALQQARKSFKG